MARIEIALGDITRLPCDAIVNAANSALSGGGGVDGAIHRAAGPDLLAACRALGRCPPGEAVITPGFRLPARHVIHAVGPVWRGGTHREAELLASCYRRSLTLADGHALDSITFPGISTGIYGYPLREATAVAIAAVQEFLQNPGSVRRVVFCCYSPDAAGLYRAVLEKGGHGDITPIPVDLWR